MTNPMLDPRGLWVPIVTPLRDDAVDLATLERLARRLLTDGCAGLVGLGTTGEPATLRRDERHWVIETLARACADTSKPLIVGVGSNCTRSTIDDAREIEALAHPAAFLVVVPYYTRPSEAAIVEHFAAVATAVSTPLLIYNIPYRTGRSLGPEAILELAGHPGIIGLKQSVGALDHDTLEILRGRPASFAILAGDDAYIVPTVLMGGGGAIAASAHLCTRTFADMVDAALVGEVATAVSHARTLLPVIDAGYTEPNPAGWKAALHARGEIESPAVRPPLTSALPESTAALLTAIGNAAPPGASQT
jgi:4-hydroxy-tetrahydrodipicolinate synthase